MASAIDPIGRTRPSHLKLSLAAYSFRDYLAGPKPSMDLFEFIDRAADLGLDAVEPTSYYFPEDVTDEDLHRLKRHAFLQGLDISGTAILNDFCLPPGDEADRDREHVRAWIGHAAELHAPVLRVMSGNWRQGTPEEELEERVVRKIKELLPCAAEKGVILALENHGGGVTETAERLLRLVRAIQGPNFGVNLDTGNFHGEDPYTEIARAAPYAVNVQVKTEIRRKGRTKEPADLAKVIGILREARYSGYVVLEYDAAEDAMTAVPRYVKTLRSLID
jgi:sugar phosphate isomerase/epimerase